LFATPDPYVANGFYSPKREENESLITCILPNIINQDALIRYNITYAYEMQLVSLCLLTLYMFRTRFVSIFRSRYTKL